MGAVPDESLAPGAGQLTRRAAPALRKRSASLEVALEEAAAVPPRFAQLPCLIGDRSTCRARAGDLGARGACPSGGAAPSRRAVAPRPEPQVAIEDYDPAKPEYVQAATERQVLEAEMALLRRQAASLASALGVRSAAPPSQQNCDGVLAGYRRVLDETRHQLSKAAARLADLPPDAPEGEQGPAGDGMPASPQSEESCNGVEVDSTRASTCAVSDLEELLLPAPEASLEKLEGHAAGQRAGSGSGRWPESAPVHEEECSLEGAAVQQGCSIFGVPLPGIAFRACAC